jgi:hypothetical protein
MERTDEKSPRQLWRIEKQGEGDIQILHTHQGDVWALDVDLGEDNAPILSLRDNNAGQLWKLNSSQPVDEPDDAAPLTVVDLRPRLISQKVNGNEPLPPASVVLENSHDEQLLITLRDVGDKAGPRELKIPAGQSKTLRLKRDAGATIVETWEIPLRSGEVTIQQRERAVPPRRLYTVSVYELFVQSLAIDATKRGKGKIEDISFSPRSIGLFSIPPGEELEDGAVIDVYREARRHRNPGAIDHLDPSDWQTGETPDDDPIKKILRRQRQIIP